MAKTFGSLALVGDKWEMRGLAPHVAIRLKHIFPRVPKWQRDTFTFPNDSIHCADLSWFTSRYPLAMSLDDQLSLEGGRSQFESNQASMEQIIRPDYKPSSITGLRQGQVLRRYQGQAVDLALARLSLLLGDGVGLGKTYTAAGFILKQEARPAAVVVEPHLQNQWKSKLEEFTTLRVHKIKGTKPYNLPDADVYIYKYSQLLGWIDTFDDHFFKSVIFDEIQQLRTGEDSGKGKAAKRLADGATYRLGLSATPIYGYGAEIWNIMLYIDPSVLGSKQDFIREWCPDGREVADPDALGSFLREQNVFLRRSKKDVGQDMPAVNHITENIEPDRETIASIHDLASKLAMKTQTGTFMERGRAGRELDLLMRHATGVSKARSAAQYARILIDAGEPVVIAAWHRDVYDILLEELADYSPAMYTGSESASRKDKEKARFVNGETKVLLLSLRSGAGLDGLQFVASTIIFAELDWSPKVHEQLIGRLDREGQKEPVTAIFLLTNEGSDPPMVDILGIKSSQSHGIVDPGEQLSAKYSNRSRIQALAQQYLNNKKAA